MDLFLDRPHRDLAAALRSGAPVYLPVNPVEYHGPHLSLHNDSLIAMALARDLHARLGARHDWPMLAVPDIEAGVDAVPGPGSRSTPFAVVRRLVCEACRTLADLGARRVVVVTFHGAPMHELALQAGVELLERRGVQAFAPMNLVVAELSHLTADRFPEAMALVPAAEREALARSLPFDLHAGFLETSLALHCAPESVSPAWREVPPCPVPRLHPVLLAASQAAARSGAAQLARELHLAASGVGWYGLRPFPGYAGRPHLASAEVGAVLMRELGEEQAEVAEAVFEGRARSPRPLMRWLAPLTLGGRLSTGAVPPEAHAEALR